MSNFLDRHELHCIARCMLNEFTPLTAEERHRSFTSKVSKDRKKIMVAWM